MKRCYLAVVLAFCFFVCSSHGQGSLAATQKAAESISGGKYAEALTLLTPLTKTYPKDATVWTLRGLAYNGLGDTKQSLIDFDRALAIDKAFVPALRGASQTAYLHHDPRAGVYLQQLLSVAPDNQVANAMAGVLAYEAHDCKAAAAYFGNARDNLFGSATAVEQYADCLLKVGKPSGAMEVLSRIAQMHPDSAQLKYNLAVAQLQAHQPELAIQTLSPLAGEKDSGLLNLLASVYAQANRPDDAFRTLESAIEIDPQAESNYLDLAILCLEHHQEKRSVLAASAGIGKLPKAASLFLIRGVAYAQLADYEKAESDFVEASRIEPEQPHSTIAMSLLYSDRNDLKKEREVLTQQLKTTPNDPVTNYLLADLLMRTGTQPGQPDFQQAQAYLTKSLAGRPDSAEAQILMGKMLEKEDSPAPALEHFQAALAIEPENRSALDHEFALLRKLHRNDEAMEVLAKLKLVLNNELKNDNNQMRVESRAATP